MASTQDEEIVRTVMTRAEVVRALGVSETTTRRLERAGRLASTVDPVSGAHLFSPEDVKAVGEVLVARGRADGADADASGVGRRTGASAMAESLVFGDLDAGRPLTQIVQERHISPARVRALHKDWMELREVDVAAPVMPQVLQAALDEVAALRQRLESLVSVFGKWTRYLRTEPWKATTTCPGCGQVAHMQGFGRCPSCQTQSWIG